MSGSSRYEIKCPKCGTSNELRGRAMTLALTCQSCKVYFRTGPHDTSQVEFMYSEPQHIPLGTRGKIDTITYEVMGFMVKQEDKYKYRWREYLVFNPMRGYAFLSEYNGHWNFIWPIEDDPVKNINNHSFHYQNHKFDLYQKYEASVVYACGEFFFDVVDLSATTQNHEYISPPYLITREKSADSLLFCKGEYFTQQEIARAFSMTPGNLPDQTGMGYTQAVSSNFSSKALVHLSWILILFVIVIQMILYNSSAEKEVFHAEYYQSDLHDQKMVVTPSFILEGGKKSLLVNIHAPLSNDWFFSEFTLINDETGEEHNFTKEVELYSGYDEGELWTEGSQNAEAYIAQVPAGKYHLNIYPEFSFNNHSFSITLTRDVFPTVNFYITLIGLLLYPFWFFIRQHQREKERWSDSDYSPYYSD